MTIARRIHNLIHPKLGCIMMLHQVCTEYGTRSSELCHSKSMMISASDLEELVNNHKRKGWRFVSIDQVCAELANENPGFRRLATQKFACLTFDDGYLDTYTVAYPLLSRLEVPFCIYMTCDFYHGTATPNWDNNAKMMNVEQLLEMSRSPLCTIGAHSCSHPRLSKLSAEEQRSELLECKNDLEQLLGEEIRHLAYPHGDYNKTTIKIASELGFATAVTTSGRYIRDDSRLMELDRVVSF